MRQNYANFHKNDRSSLIEGDLRQSDMLPLILVALVGAAQSTFSLQHSNTAEDLRGVSAVSRKVAWASGTHGTYLRTTDGGRTWTPAQVPDAASLDFRAVVAFSADEAFLMSAGPVDKSRIYHTADAGRHWQLQFSNSNPKGFFDSMVFWDRNHGLVLGDPVTDDSGQLKFELLFTDDGEHWHQIPPAHFPPAKQGEGAFAASNTCLAILHSSVIARTSSPVILSGAVAPAKPGQLRSRRLSSLGTTSQARPNPNIWFATGGTVARVFHSSDRGQSWQVFNTPLIHGRDSTGIFSVAFGDELHGVIAGGDYKHPDEGGPNLAFTNDGGKTWTLSTVHPQAYFSSAAHDKATQRLLIVAQHFILDFGTPPNPTRLSTQADVIFNAISPYPEGGALIVGAKGAIAAVP